MKNSKSGLRKLGAAFLLALSSAVLLAAGCERQSSNFTGLSSAGPGAAGPFAAKGGSHSSSFTVLADQAVTLTDATITGDVGTFQATPTGSVTQTTSTVDGTIHVGDADAIAAFEAFVADYDALANEPCDEVLTGTLADVTLAPGVYCFDAAADLTGVLTLDGPSNGTWLFKIGEGGTGALTGTSFTVVMAGGAQECNVRWWVAEAATLTDSDFIGTILAGAAITLTRGTFHGNAWAQADATITDTTVVGCDSGGANGKGKDKQKCNQGVGNGPEGCDPGNSNNHKSSNDENGGTPGNPGHKNK
ncbi:MAG TPA: ice-binding family protein [Planctomycetota bacterium]|nr:ice-binding family protein [Planctomycetota bacterium]